MRFAAVLLLAAVPVFASAPAECPAGANAHARFEIVDEREHALPGARVLFTAMSWDSVLDQRAGAEGIVEVQCVAAGGYYDATILHPGYESVHVSVLAEERPATRHIVMTPGEGRYARVTLGGVPVPGVTVVAIDGNGLPWAQGTDDDGRVVYPELYEGTAFLLTMADEFVSQRTILRGADRNGPIRFELTPLAAH